jgi:hypothetical protein
MRRWAKEGLITLKKITVGNNVRYIADKKDAVLHPVEKSGECLMNRLAAAHIGLPVSVLRQLKETDHYVGAHRHRLKQGYHPRDLDSLRDRLLETAPALGRPRERFHVDLSALLRCFRFHGEGAKTQFVVDVLEGKINAAGKDGDSLSNLLFDRRQVEEYVANARSIAARGTVPVKEAARIIGCDQHAVRELASGEHLRSEPGRESLRISRESVTAFCFKYVALNALAKELQTSSRRLAALCRAHQLRLLVMTGGGGLEVPFVEQAQKDELVSLSARFPARPRPVKQLQRSEVSGFEG